MVALAASIAWAFDEVATTKANHRDRLMEHIDGLSQGLSLLLRDISLQELEDKNRLTQDLDQQFSLRQPLRHLKIIREETVLAELGTINSKESLEKEDLLIIKRSLDPSQQRKRRHHSKPPDGSQDLDGEPDFTHPPSHRFREELPPGVHPPGAHPPGTHPPGMHPPGAHPPGTHPPGAYPPNNSKEARKQQSAKFQGIELIVTLDSRLPHHLARSLRLKLATVLLLAWLTTLSILFAQYRILRSKILSLALEKEQIERARLNEMNIAAAGLAHETMNPLGLILGLAQRLASNPETEDHAKQVAEQIMEEADRASSRLSDFINFAAHRPIHQETIELSETVQQISDALADDFKDAGITLKISVDHQWIIADKNLLEQILVNLLLNSLRASEKDSCTEIRSLRHGDTLELIIQDQGSGIPPAIRAKLFQPYVTTSAEGHGLGLAMVKKNVIQHSWEIAVTDAIPHGARFTISKILCTSAPRSQS